MSVGVDPVASPELIPLNRLRSGQWAIVEQVTGLPEQVRRLEELGFRDGISVEVVQSGSPCIVRLGTKKMCFRSAEVLGILVRTGDSS